MSWKFSDDKPIYLQIIDIILTSILNGEYAPGSKVPTVRELASDLQVNPNTLQRAFSELEKMEVINVQRTNGRFVTENSQLIDDLRMDNAVQLTINYLGDIKKIGYQKSDAVKLIDNIEEE